MKTPIPNIVIELMQRNTWDEHNHLLRLKVDLAKAKEAYDHAQNLYQEQFAALRELADFLQEYNPEAYAHGWHAELGLRKSVDA